MGLRRAIALSLAVVTTLWAGRSAGEPDAVRSPIPEPIFGETVTDIDGTEAGEIEVELNGSVLRALHGGAYSLDGSVELEWLVTRRLGLRLEPSVARDAVGGPPGDAAGVSGGLSWKLFQDFQHDFHVDLEVLGRVPWDSLTIAQPGDPAQPLAVDLRAALRLDWLTLRGGVGVGAFGQSDHVPLRAGLAALAPFESSGRFGFWGVELDADGARSAPVVCALNLVPNFTPAGLPFRIGLALPWTIGERDDRPSVGVFLRLFYESEREIEFAAGREVSKP
jgi:hypothetical protein